jgi:hypothetical protein
MSSQLPIALGGLCCVVTICAITGGYIYVEGRGCHKYPGASNYNPDAIWDDGSCIKPETYSNVGTGYPGETTSNVAPDPTSLSVPVEAEPDDAGRTYMGDLYAIYDGGSCSTGDTLLMGNVRDHRFFRKGDNIKLCAKPGTKSNYLAGVYGPYQGEDGDCKYEKEGFPTVDYTMVKAKDGTDQVNLDFRKGDGGDYKRLCTKKGGDTENPFYDHHFVLASAETPGCPEGEYSLNVDDGSNIFDNVFNKGPCTVDDPDDTDDNYASLVVNRCAYFCAKRDD